MSHDHANYHSIFQDIMHYQSIMVLSPSHVNVSWVGKTTFYEHTGIYLNLLGYVSMLAVQHPSMYGHLALLSIVLVLIYD
jgi:hypothetical protein